MASSKAGCQHNRPTPFGGADAGRPEPANGHSTASYYWLDGVSNRLAAGPFCKPELSNRGAADRGGDGGSQRLLLHSGADHGGAAYSHAGRFYARFTGPRAFG